MIQTLQESIDHRRRIATSVHRSPKDSPRLKLSHFISRHEISRPSVAALQVKIDSQLNAEAEQRREQKDHSDQKAAEQRIEQSVRNAAEPHVAPQLVSTLASAWQDESECNDSFEELSADQTISQPSQTVVPTSLVGSVDELETECSGD